MLLTTSALTTFTLRLQARSQGGNYHTPHFQKVAPKFFRFSKPLCKPRNTSVQINQSALTLDYYHSIFVTLMQWRSQPRNLGGQNV